MDDISITTVLAIWPLPEAISALHHELRVPLVRMRAALQLIERFDQPAALACDLQPLLASIDHISSQLDRLLDLRDLVISKQGAAPLIEELHQSSQRPIEVLQEIVAQLHESTAALHLQTQARQETCSRTFRAEAQQLFALFQSNHEAWGIALDDWLCGQLDKRLRALEDHTPVSIQLDGQESSL